MEDDEGYLCDFIMCNRNEAIGTWLEVSCLATLAHSLLSYRAFARWTAHERTQRDAQMSMCMCFETICLGRHSTFDE